MKDERPHIIATCANCGFRFDVLFGVGCPQCRTEAVKQAFAPLDPLRTALGVGLVPDAVLEDVWHWHGEPYKRVQDEFSRELEPRGCKMPKGAAAQVYELKRLRKLIGKL